MVSLMHTTCFLLNLFFRKRCTSRHRVCRSALSDSLRAKTQENKLSMANTEKMTDKYHFLASIQLTFTCY